MTGLAQDIRYAWRQFQKAPGFPVVALLILALGIGVNSGVFSVDAILLRALPFPHGEELMLIRQSVPKGRNPHPSLPPCAWRSGIE
jgi:putative ABC transport system permease protein